MSGLSGTRSGHAHAAVSPAAPTLQPKKCPKYLGVSGIPGLLLAHH